MHSLFINKYDTSDLGGEDTQVTPPTPTFLGLPWKTTTRGRRVKCSMFPSCIVALLLVAVIIKDVGVVSAAVWQGSSTGVEAVWGWCKNKRAKVPRLMSAEAEDFQSEMTSFFPPLISCTTFKPTTWTVTPARTQLLQKWRLSEFSCQRAGWPKISTIFLPFFHHQWSVGLSDVHPRHCWLLKQMENRPRIHSSTISYYHQLHYTT